MTILSSPQWVNNDGEWAAEQIQRQEAYIIEYNPIRQGDGGALIQLYTWTKSGCWKTYMGDKISCKRKNKGRVSSYHDIETNTAETP